MDARPCRRLTRLVPKESAALFSSFADYFGLATLTPTLPYYLAELGVLDIELWTGAIVSSQFAAVVVGNFFWGLFSDRFGPARALQLTLLGDAIFFGLSAAATTTWSLILIRFSAGLFSPLVPALSFIFQTLRPEEMVGGMGRYTISITTAYFLGAALIGIAYETIGWLGTSLVTCAIAALAALYAFVLPVPASVAAAAAAVRVPSSGVRDALRSPEFIAHGSTAFAMGWLMNLALSVAVIELQLNFKFSVAEVSYVFLSVPAIITAWALLLPTVSRAIGLRRSIGVGALLNMVSCALLASPLGSASAVSFITLFILAVVALCFQQNTNQALARGIGAKYTVNGTGAVVGASRTAWALGQAVSPVVGLALYSRFGRFTPWLATALLQAAVVVLCMAVKQPLWAADPVQSGVKAGAPDAAPASQLAGAPVAAKPTADEPQPQGSPRPPRPARSSAFC